MMKQSVAAEEDAKPDACKKKTLLDHTIRCEMPLFATR